MLNAFLEKLDQSQISNISQIQTLCIYSELQSKNLALMATDLLWLEHALFCVLPIYLQYRRCSQCSNHLYILSCRHNTY